MADININSVFDWIRGSDDDEIQELKDKIAELENKLKNNGDVNRSYSRGGGFLTNAVNRVGGAMQGTVDEKMKGPEYMTIDTITNLIKGDSGEINLNIGNLLSNIIGTALDQAQLQLKLYHDLLRKINQDTSLTGKLSKDWRDEIMKASPDLIRIGITMDELSDSMAQLIKDSGRFKLVDEDTMIKIGKNSKVFFDNMKQGVESLKEFQNVSRGASDAMEVIKDVGLRSLGLGLNAKETVKVLTENLSKLNQYGFQNGEKGLARMVRQAQELRMDMKATFDLAQKVLDPKDALSLASELQVIGGALGDFNDPIKMMWMATNNVEGLQDALVDAAESLASFDVETGTFKIMGADLRRAYAMSEQLNMSMEDFSNLAIQGAQRASALADVMSTGLEVNPDQMEFLTNLAQMKGGKMTIEIPKNLQEQFQTNGVVLENMTQKQLDALMEYQDELQAIKEPEDIIRQQVGLIENIERDVSFIAATARVTGGNAVEQVVKQLGYDPMALQKASEQLGNIGAKKVEETIKKLEKKGQEWIGGQVNNNPNQTPVTQQNVTPATNTANATPPNPKTITTNQKVTFEFKTTGVLDKLSRKLYEETLLEGGGKSFLSMLIPK